MPDQTLQRAPLIEVVVGLKLQTHLDESAFKAVSGVVDGLFNGDERVEWQFEVKVSDQGSGQFEAQPGRVARRFKFDGADPQGTSSQRAVSTRAITYSPYDISYIVLGEYPGWGELKKQFLAIHQQISQAADLAVGEAFVRYISEVSIPPSETPLDLQEYLLVLPKLSRYLDGSLRSTRVVVGSETPEPRSVTELQVSGDPTSDGSYKLRIDIVAADEANSACWEERIEVAHQREKDLFYDIITDQLRELCV